MTSRVPLRSWAVAEQWEARGSRAEVCAEPGGASVSTAALTAYPSGLVPLLDDVVELDSVQLDLRGLQNQDRLGHAAVFVVDHDR